MNEEYPVDDTDEAAYASHSLSNPERKRARCGHGHATTDMILANYQEIVSPDEADRYWSIPPAATAPNVLLSVLLFI